MIFSNLGNMATCLYNVHELYFLMIFYYEKYLTLHERQQSRFSCQILPLKFRKLLMFTGASMII